MPSGVVVSVEVPAPRSQVWDALVPVAVPPGPRSAPEDHSAGGPVSPAVRHRIGVGGTILDLDLVDPVDGVAGTAVWAGLAHRVTAHLVDLGGDRTLVVLTADEEVQGAAHPMLAGGRDALAHRQVQHDLRRLADELHRRSTAAVTTP